MLKKMYMWDVATFQYKNLKDHIELLQGHNPIVIYAISIEVHKSHNGEYVVKTLIKEPLGVNIND